MAYFTGAASNAADLLTKIRLHAEAAGWVTDKFTASEWYVHNADGYWSMAADNPNSAIFIAGNTGFNGGLAWNAQPGNQLANRYVAANWAYSTRWSLNSVGPYPKYHVFIEATQLFVVLEFITGTFSHMSIGTLDKKGMPYVGGQYIGNSFYFTLGTANDSRNTFLFDNFTSGAVPWGYNDTVGVVRYDNHDEAKAPGWLSMGAQSTYSGPNFCTGSGRIIGGGYSFQYGLFQCGYDAATEEPVLLPCPIHSRGANERWRYLGDVRDFAIIRGTNLAPGDSVFVGPDEWMCFPMMSRALSGEVYHAYRRTT